MGARGAEGDFVQQGCEHGYTSKNYVASAEGRAGAMDGTGADRLQIDGDSVSLSFCSP